MKIREAGTPRIGCVPYLNARPLLMGLEAMIPPVRRLVPAKLYESFQAGELDAALLSSIDVMAMDNPGVVDGVSISSRGAVHSVVMAYTGNLQEVTKVALDPASHTSNALLRIVLEEFSGLEPEYVQNTDKVSENDVRLLIGDPAISYRERVRGSQVQFLDLGGEWFRNTGLPFVYALWTLKKDFTNKKEVSEMLREAKAEGIRNRAALAALESDPEFALRYLTESIRYDLGEEEKRGLKLFGEYLKNRNKVADTAPEFTYY